MSVDDFVEPLGMRVLIRKDESRHKTRGGIVIPDKVGTPTIPCSVFHVRFRG